MISDILSDAVRSITFYQQQYPDMYHEIKGEIDTLVSHMEAMRDKLDAPPDGSAMTAAINSKLAELLPDTKIETRFECLAHWGGIKAVSLNIDGIDQIPACVRTNKEKYLAACWQKRRSMEFENGPLRDSIEEAVVDVVEMLKKYNWIK